MELDLLSPSLTHGTLATSFTSVYPVPQNITVHILRIRNVFRLLAFSVELPGSLDKFLLHIQGSLCTLHQGFLLEFMRHSCSLHTVCALLLWIIFGFLRPRLRLLRPDF
jgi:hypothetical protein